MSLSKFSIDDAFDSDEDDNVRVYGSTRQTPVKGPKNRGVTSDEIPLTECQYDFPNQNEKTLLPSEKTSWWRHPKIKQNFRVVFGAVALTVIGLALLITGIGILASSQRGWHCMVFFVGGALCLIPGAYHVVYIYLAINNIAGYSLYNLPVFNR